MKKINYLVLTLVMVVAMGFVSCKKECTCNTYLDGVKMGETTTKVKGKCSDLDTRSEVMGTVSEVKCK